MTRLVDDVCSLSGRIVISTHFMFCSENWAHQPLYFVVMKIVIKTTETNCITLTGTCEFMDKLLVKYLRSCKAQNCNYCYLFSSFKLPEREFIYVGNLFM